MRSKITFCDKEMIIDKKNKVICLSYSKIVDISTNRPYVVISTMDNQSIYLEASLIELEENLPIVFFRCNQSSIINLFHVTCYKENEIYLVFGKVFILSFAKKKLSKQNYYILDLIYFNVKTV
jgi:DNA-binding LytR/AlgR family response regulator